MNGLPDASDVRDVLLALWKLLTLAFHSNVLMLAAVAAFVWAASLVWGRAGALTVFGVCAVILALANADKKA